MHPQSPEPTRATACRWVLAVASGVLLTLSYPPFSCSVLAWVALAPLVYALEGTSLAAGLFLGWLTGTVESLGVTGYWMYHAAHDYFQLSPVAAAAFTVAINQIFVSLYYAGFGFAAALCGLRRWYGLAVPVLFVASEYARAHVLSGNPWALLGHSQTNLVIIQVCDLTGVYGLSFLLALTAVAVAQVGQTRAPTIVAALLLLGVCTYGVLQLAHDRAITSASLQVALVQANLPNSERGRPELYAAHLERYLELTAQAAAPAPALIVWPENAVGFFPVENGAFLQRITDALRSPPAALLAGAPRAGEQPGVAAIHNAAYLFTGAGVASVYDKRILLPFVERMPLRPADGPYVAGTEPAIFNTAGIRFAALICYEVIYPELSREVVQRGAQLLVNISNDSWFEAGAGPEQHHAIARFRAVENRVSLVRVTNSGVSGVFDQAGREIARLPTRVAAAQSVTVPITVGGSFYSRSGDVFAIACLVASVVAVILGWLGRMPH